MKTVEFTDHFSPDSSAIKNVWYDDENLELYVEFNNGQIAGYKDVTPYEFRQFLDASSAGKYYTSHIKKHYPGIDGNVRLVERVKANLSTFEIDYTASGSTKIDADDFVDAIEKFRALSSSDRLEVVVKAVRLGS